MRITVNTGVPVRPVQGDNHLTRNYLSVAHDLAWWRMSRAGGTSVQANLTVRVPADLRDAFEAKAAVADRKADDVLRELMQAYVDRGPEPEEGYDEWFRQMVQESIDDPRPSVPHEAVVDRTTAIIDRVAAGMVRRED